MYKLNRLLLFISAIALIFLIQQPQIVVATSNQTIQSIQSIEQEAQELYQQNQYSEAIALLKTAIKQYQQQGDRIGRAIATRNLALIYQKLGEWEQAKATLTQAEQLIQAINHEPERSQLLAQVGEVKGQVELSLGRSQAALETWQQATSLYEEQGNISGLIQGKIYQAYALQALGLYSQSIKTLTATKKQLQNKPDTLIKAQALLNLGDVLNRVGKYQAAQTTLNSGLAIAKKLEDNSTIADIFLSLGNNARFQERLPVALDYYQQAIDIAPQPSIQLRAKLDLLGVLISLQDKKATSNLVTEIEQLLTQLPEQQTTIQGQISLARHLLNLDTEPRQIAELLVSGIKQAQKLDIKRTEAEALGVLGHLYERNQQWSAARAITQKALVTAQSINARELTYQWQWQLGRILKAQGNRAKAIAAYTQATDNLQILRSDLVAISSDVQYSFRDQIEPVYRELAVLLLDPQASQAELNQTRQIIESLQVAELDNFFRDACLDTKPQQIDQLDPTAAVIYTIVLGNRLEVVAAIPNQPLRHYATKLPPAEIELVITSANSQLLEPRRLNLKLFQQAYDWLIRPLEAELKTNNIQTLVFVPDGILRNLPPAALHDGQQYLIEKYSVAIAPSLQLTELQAIDVEQQNILLAGLSESRQGFPSLPGVKQEIERIQPLFTSSVLLNDSFTELNFNRFASQTPFRVVHLATHGQFSSNADDTFILTWDNRINIDELSRLLRGDSKQLRPIDLLVLSACETASGDRLAALGLAGIAVRAGARSTVASLWPVSDLATATLMTHFYEALAQGNITKAEALRQAQISTLKNDSFAHPFFWSAFILVGNWL
ncbi:CHAT domain-containing protein [Pleurocapsa sp. PCC 7319]|uniref:CHAT domain-containing protein n=1 Tax=Pleurocapsa sp. PCC 7319 TaxID=118161 RepID=UPI00034B13A1|nr:CHAT domain-containing protein [Pleurocapsa sp. PCC 7319]